MKRNFLLTSGRTKLRRWWVCLHEAKHAVCYSRLCRVWASAHIFADHTGVCFHGPVPDVRLDAVAVAAAQVGEVWWRDVPSKRPRRGPRKRRPDFATMKPDAVLLSDASKIGELEMKLGERQHCFDLAAIMREAEDFVWRYENASAILQVARTLFQQGRMFVPPNVKQFRGQVDVPPADINHIAGPTGGKD